MRTEKRVRVRMYAWYVWVRACVVEYIEYIKMKSKLCALIILEYEIAQSVNLIAGNIKL